MDKLFGNLWEKLYSKITFPFASLDFPRIPLLFVPIQKPTFGKFASYSAGLQMWKANGIKKEKCAPSARRARREKDKDKYNK